VRTHISSGLYALIQLICSCCCPLCCTHRSYIKYTLPNTHVHVHAQMYACTRTRVRAHTHSLVHTDACTNTNASIYEKCIKIILPVVAFSVGVSPSPSSLTASCRKRTGWSMGKDVTPRLSIGLQDSDGVRCVCICVCLRFVSVYVYVCVCVPVYVCVAVCACVCVCVCRRGCVCVCLRACVYVCACMPVYVSACVSECVPVCNHVHTCNCA